MSKSNLIFKTLTGLLVSLLLMFLDSLGSLGWLRGAVEVSVRPQTIVVGRISSRINQWSNSTVFWLNGADRLNDLEKRLAVSEQKLIDLRNENEKQVQLEKVLGAEIFNRQNLIPANVLSSGSALIIENQGFEVGETVISPAGVLIGTIESVGIWSVKVKRLSDAKSQLSVKILDADKRPIAAGIIMGEFGGYIKLEQVLTEVDLKPKQTAVSSGEDGAVPPGLLIGWVGNQIEREESAVYQSAQIEPAENFSSLKTVMIIKP